MKRIALTLAALAGVALVAGPSVARERLTGDQKLAKLLEGRVAGAPQNCINTRVNSDSQVIDKTAVCTAAGGRSGSTFRRTRATSIPTTRC